MDDNRPAICSEIAEVERWARERYPHTFRDAPDIDTSRLRDETCEVVESVLGRVQRVSEQDYRRILQCVVAVEPLTAEEAKDGTAGQWFRDHSAEEMGRAEGINWPGMIKVNEDASNLTFVLAHEFGHACETHEDTEEHQCGDAEWMSEAIANRYVYLWGFRQELAKFWAGRDLDPHHGCPPGMTFTVYGENYVVTDDHRIILAP